MATRGPKPTPTKILELRGSWRGHSRPREPQPRAEIPGMPKELDARGKKIWRMLTRDLAAIGLLARIDQHALARYIQLYQRWQRLQAFIEAHDETYPVMRRFTIAANYDSEGNLVPSREVEVFSHTALRHETRAWLALSDRLLRLEQHFGMTPSARAAIGILLAGAEHYGQDDAAPNPKRFLNLG